VKKDQQMSSFRIYNTIAHVVFVCLLLGKVTSSSCSSDAPESKYDVFVSFRGPDVREGFLSHLIEALSQNKITFFVD